MTNSTMDPEAIVAINDENRIHYVATSMEITPYDGRLANHITTRCGRHNGDDHTARESDRDGQRKGGHQRMTVSPFRRAPVPAAWCADVVASAATADGSASRRSSSARRLSSALTRASWA